MVKAMWERPELRTIELGEVESLADLEVAFTSFCCLPCVDL
jgi:hypothetical protein